MVRNPAKPLRCPSGGHGALVAVAVCGDVKRMVGVGVAVFAGARCLSAAVQMWRSDCTGGAHACTLKESKVAKWYPLPIATIPTGKVASTTGPTGVASTVALMVLPAAVMDSV